MASTTASYRANSKLARTNNDDLQTCLSSSLPLSIRTIYPCSTLANQNSSQYQCDHFNVNGLSSVRGGRISHFPAVIVYATDSNDVQNVVKCATKLNYIVNARSGGHSYEGYSLGSMYNNIVINMEAINYIRINQYDGTGTFGAGARIGPIYYRTYQYNYTINAGSCAWMGLAGHALGGGLGIDGDSGDNQQLLLDGLTYPTYYFKAKHLFYDGPISSHSLDKFIDRLASGDGQINMGFNSWDGYLSTIPADETAFPHRHFKFGIQFTVYPNDEQHEQQQMNWLNQVRARRADSEYLLFIDF
ncbi:unnamed protein product [Rotaria sordida]|uniref:FAD-binding PCMH-type domain-containing protein n=2 Tax=Rotaria sordida TaxID=392033 RepID=A0A813V2W2_9BILA|nr:unnamed protein product [Rotaria sordida]